MLRERTFDPFQSFERGSSRLWLPPGVVQPPKPIGVDLFCGAGGFSLGFHQAGWHVAGALEWDWWPMATYLANLGSPETVIHFLADDAKSGWREGQSVAAGEVFDSAGTGWIAEATGVEPCEHFWYGDVRKITGGQIMETLGLEEGELGCVFGGPPCQGFSVAGKQDVMDPRNSLVFDFARIVVESRPKAMMMENVRGMVDMVTPEGVPVIDALARVMADGGFSTYDALKRSLTDNAKAALRQDGGRPSKSKGKTPDPETTLSLFDEVA